MARQVVLTSAPLSKSQQKSWEKVLLTECEFELGREYRDLDEDGKRQMLCALDTSVRGMLAHIGLSQKRMPHKKAAKAGSKGDALLEALQASGVKYGLLDEELSFLREQLLPSWGVPRSVDSLLMYHGMAETSVTEQSEQGWLATSHASVQKPNQESSWNYLKLISVLDLQLFKVMKGARIECEVVGSPNHMVGITTIIQDASGNAVMCGIYNLPGVDNQAAASKALPRGCTLVIAEPFLKIMKDGNRGIRVDNPAELRIFLPGVRPLPQTGSIPIRRGSASASKAREAPEIATDLLSDFRVGERVRLVGLTSKKGVSLNGKLGVVASQDEDDLERVTVEVDSETGKPEVMKVKPSNLEHIPEASMEAILQTKNAANEAFRQEAFKEAVDGYSHVVSQLCSRNTVDAREELCKCLCNRALSFLRLAEWKAAKADCEAVLEKEPSNVKAHFRLASALFQEGKVANQQDVEHAAHHVCIAIALSQATEASMTGLLDSVASSSAKPVATAKEVVAVSNVYELERALNQGGFKFICLKPGLYSSQMPCIISADVTLVGVGEVTFLKGRMHFLSVVGGRVHLNNVKVTDGPDSSMGQACFAVQWPAAWLVLSHCVVEECREVGVIVAQGARCTVEDCRFARLGRQAIEVVEMGEVYVRRSQFIRVWQGVCAYGGAQNVTLEDVLIEGSSNEGVYASGDVKTDETEKLEELCPDMALGERRQLRSRDEVEARAQARNASMLATGLAKSKDWTGRLVLSMSNCTITSSQGLACSLDEGCAACLTRCTFQKATQNKASMWPGTGLSIKGGCDVAVSGCRFLQNAIGISLGFNYAGDVCVEDSVFSRNHVQDIREGQSGEEAMLQKLPAHIRKLAENQMAQDPKEQRKREAHKQAGAWSIPIRQARNQFLGKAVRVPDVHELQSSAGAPLPQKVAWEAAARGRHALPSPCLCGFACTELGNSPDCGQIGLENHIDFPPFMCLPCSDALSERHDDANAQFYFHEQESRKRSRHWCLLGAVMSLETPRSADAHSFMAFRGAEAAICARVKTKFSDSEPDVDVLFMLDEQLALRPGCTLAILYAEANDIDITRGTGQVVVTDSSLVYSFASPLEDVISHSLSCRQEGEASLCGNCGNLALVSLTDCSLFRAAFQLHRFATFP